MKYSSPGLPAYLVDRLSQSSLPTVTKSLGWVDAAPRWKPVRTWSWVTADALEPAAVNAAVRQAAPDA